LRRAAGLSGSSVKAPPRRRGHRWSSGCRGRDRARRSCSTPSTWRSRWTEGHSHAGYRSRRRRRRPPTGQARRRGWGCH
jgi:hypothetical protein